MSFRLCPIVLVAVLLSRPQPVAAQEHPLLGPAHNVTVTYAVSRAAPDNVANKVRLSYFPQGPMVRVDSYVFRDGRVPFNTVIYNGVEHRRFILVYQLQAYFVEDLPAPDMPELVLDETMQFSRQGSATIAGQSCAAWQVTTSKDSASSFCVTDDGVVLRSTTPGRTLEAIEVVPGGAPDATFAIPSDLRQLRARPPPNGAPKAAQPPG